MPARFQTPTFEFLSCHIKEGRSSDRPRAAWTPPFLALRDTNILLPKSVNQRPMGAFLGRLFDRDDDKIAIGGGGNDMGSGIRPFLPAIGLLDQFSFLVVNMDRNLCPVHFCTQPKPIFVAFEQLLAHCLLFARSKV